jgi:hypothetical protein
MCLAILGGIHYYLSSVRNISGEETQKKSPSSLPKILTASPTFVEIRNVNFIFDERVKVFLKNITGEIKALPPFNYVNFDDVSAFIIQIKSGEVFIDPSLLLYIFGEKIFNFEESTLKLESISFPKNSQNQIVLKGELKFVVWLGFTMKGRVGLEKDYLVITAEEITAVGSSYAKSLLSAVGLNLEKLILLPSENGVAIRGNRIFVNPFAILPPPKMNGVVKEIETRDGRLWLRLDSGENPIQFPKPPDPISKNYLYLYKGNIKFAKLIMYEANLQMVDRDQDDYFEFYLARYFSVLNRGYAMILPDQSVKVIMHDYDDFLNLR